MASILYKSEKNNSFGAGKITGFIVVRLGVVCIVGSVICQVFNGSFVMLHDFIAVYVTFPSI